MGVLAKKNLCYPEYTLLNNIISVINKYPTSNIQPSLFQGKEKIF